MGINQLNHISIYNLVMLHEFHLLAANTRGSILKKDKISFFSTPSFYYNIFFDKYQIFRYNRSIKELLKEKIKMNEYKIIYSLRVMKELVKRGYFPV